MSSTTDGGKNPGLRASTNCVLYIGDICAARDQSGHASYHAIPNGACFVVPVFAGTQQVTLKSSAERRVYLFAGFDHLVISSQNIL
jgi:hypothetical protein